MRVLYTNCDYWRWSPGALRRALGNGRIVGEELDIEGSIERKTDILVDDGYITSITASSSSSVSETGACDKVVDLQGKLLLPGLHDSHIHVGMLGEAKYFLDLSGCGAVEDLKQALRAHCDAHPSLGFIIGVNWCQSRLTRLPHRRDLDEVCSDRPVFLWRSCWHIGVANSRALLAAGIYDSSASGPRRWLLACWRSVDGGVIDAEEDVDEEGAVTVAPTGILKERACEFVTAVLDSLRGEPERETFISEGLALCLRRGLTSVQTNDARSVGVYRRLQSQGNLVCRVFLTPNHDDLALPESGGGLGAAGPLRFMRIADASSREAKLFIDRVKIFGDGSLGAETAALRLEGDSHGSSSGGHSGVLIHSPGALVDMVGSARARGYRLEIHAIGDAAAAQVLAACRAAGSTAEERPVMTHCQVLGADIIDNMRIMGVVANVQPSFVPTDMKWVRDRLPAQQLQHAYAWRSLLAAGVRVAGGSDAPIESCSPFAGIHDAMMRSSRGGAETFKADERLTFAEALYLYTLGAAVASGSEELLGNITEGCMADFVVVDEQAVLLSPSSFDCPPSLLTYEPLSVIVGGEIVYQQLGEALEGGAGTLLQGPFVPGRNGQIRPPVVLAGLCRDGGGEQCRCRQIRNRLFGGHSSTKSY